VLKELEDAGLLVRRKLSSGRTQVRLQYAAGEEGEGTAPLFETAKAKVPKGDSGPKVPKRHGGEVVPISNKERKVIKSSIGGGSKVLVPSPFGMVEGGEVNKVIELFEPVNPSFRRLFSNTTQRKAMERMVGQYGVEKIRRAVEFAVSVQGKDYAPTITTPAQLEDRMGALVVFARKQGHKGPAVMSL